jgi:hypothetical protein
MGTFTLKELFVFIAAIAAGVGALLGSTNLLSAYGEPRLLVIKLCLFIIGISLLYFGSFWFLIRVFTRR